MNNKDDFKTFRVQARAHARTGVGSMTLVLVAGAFLAIACSQESASSVDSADEALAADPMGDVCSCDAGTPPVAPTPSGSGGADAGKPPIAPTPSGSGGSDGGIKTKSVEIQAALPGLIVCQQACGNDLACYNMCAGALALAKVQGCPKLLERCTSGTFFGCGAAKSKALAETCMSLYLAWCSGK